MAGFVNDANLNEIVYCNNVDFSGAAAPSAQVTADGQLLIGSSTAPNIRVGTLTSSDGSITWTVGHGTISGIVTAGGAVLKTLTGNSGGAITPSVGNINTLGTGSITIVGSGHTLTTQLTGLTNNAIQVGAGTATLTQLGPTNSATLVTSSSGVPSLAAMTSGQLIIGNTGGTPTAAVPTSTGGNFITGTGSLKYIPANYQQGFSNIGFTYSAGTFTVAGFDGTALSATNPGYITVQNPSTAGNLLTIAVTSNQTFTDGSGGTVAGMKFGLPYGGTDVSWAQNMPMFLYAVTKSDGTAIAFMISRNPNARKSPAAAGIGQSGSVVNVNQTDMFSLASITAANYASQPCVYIGCFQVRYTAGTPSFYTVQALTGGIDGPGLNYNNDTGFSMPTGANGAATGSYFMANGGTAPIWTTQGSTYYVRSDGTIKVQFQGNTTLSTAGVGAVNARFTLPYAIPVTNVPIIGGMVILNNGGGYSLLSCIADTGSSQIYTEVSLMTGNAKTQNASFTTTNAGTTYTNLQYQTTIS